MRAVAALLTAVLAVLFFSHAAAAAPAHERVSQGSGPVAVYEAHLCDAAFRPEEAAGHWARVRENSPPAGHSGPTSPRAGCASAAPYDCGPFRQVPYEPVGQPPPVSPALLQVFRC